MNVASDEKNQKNIGKLFHIWRGLLFIRCDAKYESKGDFIRTKCI